MITYHIWLAKALSSLNVEVKIVGFGNRPYPIQNDSRIEYLSLGRDPGYLDWFGGIFTTYSYIKDRVSRVLNSEARGSDILHFIYPEATVRSSSINQRVVATAWGFSSIGDILSDAHYRYSGLWKLFGMIADFQFHLLDTHAFKKADGIICTTSAAERVYRSVTKDRVSYLPVPVELPPAFDIKRELDTVPFSLQLLFAERSLDRPRNNVWMLLEAMKRLRPSTRRIVTLQLVGGYTPQLHTAVRNLKLQGNCINLYDYLPQIEFHKLVRAADVCLVLRYIRELPSTWMLEAMASGLAIVGLDMSAYGDLITPLRNGILIKQGDSQGLADAIELLANNPGILTRMKLESRAIIEREHDPAIVGKKYVDFYSKLLCSK